MTDKIRREFEVWFKPKKVAMQNRGISTIRIIRLHQRQWEAWRASRAAIEIDILEMKRNMESWNHDHISTPGYAMDALWRKHFGLNEAGKCDGETDVLSAK